MKILYTLPSIETPHGGYRIVLEHLTRLKALGHDVGLFIEKGRPVCPWYPTDIPITDIKMSFKKYDCIVIGSPHSIWITEHIKPHQKCFLFMQMVEELFRPKDALWLRTCKQFYNSEYPIIHGSHWGEKYIREHHGRTGPMHYIDNAVNLGQFPLEHPAKDGKTILIEGWEASNPAKDVHNIGPKVAAKLKRQGYKIVAYGFQPLQTMRSVPEVYHYRPGHDLMNQLYSEATILLKATRYDARALSPMEAMTKGTVTARAIVEGDDDLKHEYNCLRSGYDEIALFDNAMRLLRDNELRERLAKNCLNYVGLADNGTWWDRIIERLNEILCTEG